MVLVDDVSVRTTFDISKIGLEFEPLRLSCGESHSKTGFPQYEWLSLPITAQQECHSPAAVLDSG